VSPDVGDMARPPVKVEIGRSVVDARVNVGSEDSRWSALMAIHPADAYTSNV